MSRGRGSRVCIDCGGITYGRPYIRCSTCADNEEARIRNTPPTKEERMDVMLDWFEENILPTLDS